MIVHRSKLDGRVLNVWKRDDPYFADAVQQAKADGITLESDAKVIRDGNKVRVYMYSAAPAYALDKFEVKQGDEVTVYITNIDDVSVNLSGYSLGVYPDGGTDLASAALVLSGSLAPGELHVVAYEPGGSKTFEDTYSFPADQKDSIATIDGDDVVALFFGAATGTGSDAVLLDVYGVPGVDGTGEAWEYTDTYACREMVVSSPNTL